MKAQEKCCGTCVWWEFSPAMKNKAGRWKPEAHANCRYPVERIPVAFQRGFVPSHWMGRKEGADCYCYDEAKVASVTAE